MPRAIWSGSISFGLVNLPVKMYSAIHEQDLHFRQFQEGTDTRIRNKRVSEKTGKEVPYEKIVKGYELSKGHYVKEDKPKVVDLMAALEASLAAAGKSRNSKNGAMKKRSQTARKSA